MATFLVLRTRSGPEWEVGRPMEEQSAWPEHAAFMDRLVESGSVILGGPLADDHRVVLVFEAASEDAIEDQLAGDPWSGTHLETASIERWTLRLDGRR